LALARGPRADAAGALGIKSSPRAKKAFRAIAAFMPVC
jgi:hypothetical protein